MSWNRPWRSFGKRADLPDGWEKYSNVGNRIPGTRFICMKVPLKEELCRRLDAEQQFTPARMVSSLAQQGMSLRLLIDLTNTNRYYRSDEVTSLGVAYEKIYVEGHLVPAVNVVKRFCAVVDQFENDQKMRADEEQSGSVVIGVHCTHGINRTGYLVCRYLIDRKGWTVEKAITEFNRARGHSIERENYLEDLHKTVPVSLDNGCVRFPIEETTVPSSCAKSGPPCEEGKESHSQSSSSSFNKNQEKDHRADRASSSLRTNGNFSDRNRRNNWAEQSDRVFRNWLPPLDQPTLANNDSWRDRRRNDFRYDEQMEHQRRHSYHPYLPGNWDNFQRRSWKNRHGDDYGRESNGRRRDSRDWMAEQSGNTRINDDRSYASPSGSTQQRP